MGKLRYRTLLIWAVVIVASIYIYPTIGWVVLNRWWPEVAQARLDKWAAEDLVVEEPNFWRDTGQSIGRWAQFDRDRVINLGLDLQGGIHMVLGFDVTPGTLQVELDGPGYLVVRTPDGERFAKGGTFPVTVDGRVETADEFALLNIEGNPINVAGGPVSVDAAGHLTVGGEDRGQFRVVEFGDESELTAQTGPVYEAPQAALATLRENPAGTTLAVTANDREIDVQDIVLQRIRMRVNDFEAKEPVIQKLGSGQIQIQLPGEKDIQRAKNLIMKMALLKFHMVSGPDETQEVLLEVNEHFDRKFIKQLNISNWPLIRVDKNNYEAVKRMVDEANETSGVLKEGKMFAFSPPPKDWEDQIYSLYLVNEKEEMTGEGMKSAVARPDNSSPGSWQILFEFNAVSSRQFADVTEQHRGENMAIVLDGHVVSAPTIQDRIFGSGQITGSFSPDEAKDLSISLNSGSMPVPIREDYTGVVGASLGAESVSKGVQSSVIGLVVVMVFMVFYYGVGGLVANAALMMNALLVLAALAYFNATLTLPGIAGMILTVGMAVDANVLIFERIREEVRNGKSLVSAIEGGYARATVTILDANITTLIAAAVLTQFGTGPVQGFAVTLSIGVCASVFAALVVTRALLEFLTERKYIEQLTMRSIIGSAPKFQFLQKRRVAAVLSVVVIVFGSLYFASRGSDNFGVDFTNGTSILLALNAKEGTSSTDLEDVLRDAGFKDPTAQTSQEESVDDQEEDSEVKKQYLVRLGDQGAQATQTGVEGDESISTRVQRVLLPLTVDPSATDLDSQVELLKVEFVGPAVGAQLQRDAVAAIAYALLFIVAYLWFRFELKFAVGAVVALVHDVLVTVAVFSVLQRELTIPVVAALLTIIGYSLNDTIVVFDRIREDTRVYRSRGLSFAEIMNISINQTLSRTLLTSLTTLFVVLILLIFGGSAILDFALALSIGVVVGTYSSIFVASPVVLLWDQLRRRRQGPVAGGKPGGGKGPSKGRKGKKKTLEPGSATA